jgi:hypothetical protein
MRTDISMESLRRWEQGQELPRINAAKKPAAAVGVRIDASMDAAAVL